MLTIRASGNWLFANASPLSIPRGLDGTCPANVTGSVEDRHDGQRRTSGLVGYPGDVTDGGMA